MYSVSTAATRKELLISKDASRSGRKAGRYARLVSPRQEMRLCAFVKAFRFPMQTWGLDGTSPVDHN